MNSSYNNKNLQNNHPLIPNANTYICQKKFVSINSEDRDCVKYPQSSIFEIELPQDYLNVQSVRLSQWSFPANYNVFGPTNYNLSMYFKMQDVYNPSEHGVIDPLLTVIYNALSENNYSENFLFNIEIGFYNPTQMATELTNKMNEIITNRINTYIKNNPQYEDVSKLFKEYTDFVVVYNTVSQKLVFGNKNSGFLFPNNSEYYDAIRVIENTSCRFTNNGKEYSSFTTWGLPPYLGFVRCPAPSSVGYTVDQYRFYYGDVVRLGDNGIWITPSNYPGAYVHYVSAPLKINFMGAAYIYIEMDSTTSLNCIDETNPYNLSKFTVETNQTNGRVNSAFAKVAIPTTPISQWFDDEMGPYKWFDPPAERIRRLRIKIRYHNGQLVDFGSFDWSIMLEFTLLTNQIERSSTVAKFCGL